jgi:release factor glutamine methyltransferase
MPSTIAEALIEAQRILSDAGITESRLDANTLLRDVLGCDHARLITRHRDELGVVDHAKYLASIRRRTQGEPVQYIVGHQEFFGLDFAVTPDVLIPRPETEFLVERAISLARGIELGEPIIADIGTGSGCIAVSVAINLPHARVIATDISASALSVARSNAERHGIGQRVEFLEGDLLGPLDRFTPDRLVDIIVSNPPYVPEAALARLQREVREYEPTVALSGGSDGLDFYRRLLSEGGRYLKASGSLLLEIGIEQRDETAHIGRDFGWQLVEVINDLQGIPRTLSFRK